jgi:SagB-type dehydrogenase family enzyme
LAQAGSAFPPFGDGEILPLPDPGCGPADLEVTGSLRNRRTSFGLLTARPPLDVRDLGWVLSSVARAGTAGTDVAPAPRGHTWTRQWVLSNSVTGLRQRVYGYDSASNALVAGATLDVTRLQELYALSNYSLREVAAIIVITGSLEAIVAAYGARGYRMLNVEVGQATQTAYLAATARGLGVGAVLGLDNIGVNALLGIDGTGEHSMICVFLGHERVPRLRYDHALYRTEDRDGVGASQEGDVR